MSETPHAIYAKCALVADACLRGKIGFEDAKQALLELKAAHPDPNPDPTEYNPSEEWHWSIPMAVAWMIWGNEQKVRDCWDRYLKATYEWYEIDLSGDFGSDRKLAPCLLRRRDFEILARIQAECDAEGRSRAFRSAKRDLLRALEHGDIPVTAIKHDSDTRTVIPSENCIDLALEDGDNFDCKFIGPATYNRPRVLQADVRRTFPAPSASQEGPFELCTQEISLVMAAEVARKVPWGQHTNKQEFKELMVPKYGLSEPDFDKAWNAAIGRTRGAELIHGKRGRPPKKTK